MSYFKGIVDHCSASSTRFTFCYFAYFHIPLDIDLDPLTSHFILIAPHNRGEVVG
jgi:hypothetical protein